MSSCHRVCKFCDKVGLPILPVRYAVAKLDNKATEIPTSIGKDTAAIALKKAKYVLRTLREGFLYVFDEKRQHWDGYVLTPDGYYYQFDPKEQAPDLSEAKFCCVGKNEDVAKASCITVKNAKNATKVWFGFSDVEWTQATLKKHADPAFRARHMRSVDVQKWLGSKKDDHALPIGQLDKTVAEFQLDDKTGPREFEASPFPFHSRKGVVQNVKQFAESCAPGKGMILALNDPAGVLCELADLMQYHAKVFLNEPVRARKLTVSSIIDGLRNSIANNAEEDDRAAAKSNQAMMLSEGGSIAYLVSDTYRKQYDAAGTISDAETKKVRDESWDKYKEKYSEPSRQAFLKQFNAELEQLGNDWIEPLAVAHKTWLTSDHSTHYFKSNFDPNDIASGLAYEKLFTLCIQDTSDKKVIADQLTAWLEGEATNRANLLLRALALNNDALAKAVAGTAATELKMLPWDNSFDIFKRAVEAAEKLLGHTMAEKLNGKDNLTKFALQLGGPLLKVLGHGVDDAAATARRKLLLLLGTRSGGRIVAVTAQGRREDFVKMLYKQMQQASGGQIPRADLREGLREELKRMNLKGDMKKNWLVFVDRNELGEGVSGKNLRTTLGKAILTPDELDELTRHSLNKGISSLGVRLGVITAVLQVNSIINAFSDKSKAFADQKQETQQRLAAAAGGLASTVLQTASVAAEGTAWGTTPLMRRWFKLSQAEWLGATGRMIGALAGIAVAIWDGFTAVDQFNAGHRTLGALYLISAFAGGALGIGALLGFAWVLGPIGIILTVIFVLANILIAYLKDDKIQEWLERCAFGKSPTKKSADDEQKDLKLALE